MTKTGNNTNIKEWGISLFSNQTNLTPERRMHEVCQSANHWCRHEWVSDTWWMRYGVKWKPKCMEWKRNKGSLSEPRPSSMANILLWEHRSQVFPINNDPATPTGHLQHKRQRERANPASNMGRVVTIGKMTWLEKIWAFVQMLKGPVCVIWRFCGQKCNIIRLCFHLYVIVIGCN